MNILISCPSRRYRTIEILRREFAQAGYGVIATGNSSLIPALYAADQAFIAPNLHDEAYIPFMLEICQRHDVKAILTMLDDDILAISKALDQFRAIGVVPILVEHYVAQICDNKFSMYHFLVSNGFKCALTYDSFPSFLQGYEQKEIGFPVFIKPRVAYGAQGALKCRDLDELRKVSAVRSDLIIQEFLDGPEIGLDVYMDTVSKKMVSIFAKQKFAIMNGTADRSQTLKDDELFCLAEKLAQALGAIGPLNIEFFKVRGEYRVGEVNPRFGGSYFCAYDCGVNFCPLIVNNIRGIENQTNLGNYQEEVLMLKYDKILIRSSEELIL